MSLQQFLNSHKTTGDDKNFLSMNPGNKYFISKDDMKQFFRLYRVGLEQGQNLSILENSTFTYKPFIIDIDLKIPISIDEPTENKFLYTTDQIANIVKAVMTVTGEAIVDQEMEDNNLTAFLLERPGYCVKNGNQYFYKNGIHIHFPKLILNRNETKFFLIPKITKYLKQNKIEIPSCITYEELFDVSVYDKKPWFLYGSTKTFDTTNPYKISSCFSMTGDGSIFQDIDWIPYLRDFILEYSEITEDDASVIRALPEIFSLDVTNRESYWFEIDSSSSSWETTMESEDAFDYYQKLTNENLSHNTSQTFKDLNIYDENSNPQMDQFFGKLIDLLPEKYYEDYNLWIKVGFICYNYFDGCESGFKVWDIFSQQSDKYCYEKNRKLWDSMKKKDITIGTLRFFVKLEKPEEYQKACNEFSDSSLDELMNHSGTHYDFALSLYFLFRDEYVCASPSFNVWYHFDGHIWNEDEDAIGLKSKISTVLVSKFQKLKHKILNEEKETQKSEIKDKMNRLEYHNNKYEVDITYLNSICPEDEKPAKEKEIQKTLSIITKMKAEIAKLEAFLNDTDNNNKQSSDENFGKKNDTSKQIEKITKIISCLKTSPFKKNIMYEARELFYDPSFTDKTNSNPYLIAFKNGVYDLSIKEFRVGYPEDYITLKMDVNFREDFTLDSPEVRMANDFFEKIFPDPELREYFLFIQSELFVGKNRQKICQLWSGTGDNGKSVTEFIFSTMLGKLAAKLPTSLIVGKRTQSSNASPELVRAGMGCRLCILQEPEKGDRINSGLLKEMTGNDTFYARALHKMPITVKPFFKIVIICNAPPKLDDNDQAVWNRVRLIPFEAYFPKDSSLVPPTEEEQVKRKIFFRDNDLTEKIDQYVEGVAWLLLYIYKFLKPDIIKEPEKVLTATAEYREKNDYLRYYIKEYTKIGGERDSININLLIPNVITFLKQYHKGSSMPSHSDIKSYFIKEWGNLGEDNCWHGRLQSYNG